MLKNSKLSRYTVGKIIECFCVDIDASKTSLLLKLNRKTVNRYFMAFRQVIHSHQLLLKERIVGATEADKKFADSAKTGNLTGLGKKKPGLREPSVFGIYERDDYVYTEPVIGCPPTILHDLIRGRVCFENAVPAYGSREYDGLVDIRRGECFCINKAGQSAAKQAHTNGTEAFWSFTQRRLAKFNGVSRNFELHLKESEWRYNRTLPQLLTSLKLLLSKQSSDGLKRLHIAGTINVQSKQHSAVLIAH